MEFTERREYRMTLKIVGSSHREEFVKCYSCNKKFVWLNAYSYGLKGYMALCRKCRLQKEDTQKEPK